MRVSDSIALRNRRMTQSKLKNTDRANTAPANQLHELTSPSIGIPLQHRSVSCSSKSSTTEPWNEPPLPAIVSTELDPMIGLVGALAEPTEVESEYSEDPSDRSSSTFVCTDDLDEIEITPSKPPSSSSFLFDASIQSGKSYIDVIEQWETESIDGVVLDDEVDLLSRVWLSTEDPPFTESFEFHPSKMDGRSPQRLGMESWNRNPSFAKKQVKWSEPCVRTADERLMEFALQSLGTGTLPSSAFKVDPQLRVTGVDGLPWASNPTFSDEDSSTVRLPSLDLSMTTLEESNLDEIKPVLPDSIQGSNSAQNDKESEFEWMEIIKMKDAAIQKDWEEDSCSNQSMKRTQFQHRLELEDQEIVMLFDKGPMASPVPNKEVQKFENLQKRTQERKQDEIELNCTLTSRRNNRHEVKEETEQTPILCSLSFGSDCLNNLPIPSCSPSDQKPPNQVVKCMDCGKKEDRLKALEKELREMKVHMTEMEIELCNRDSIIAQQDSMIHRLTSTARSQRFTHRRTYTTFETVSNFDDVTARNANREPITTSETRSEVKMDPQDLLQKQQAQIKLMMDQLDKCRFL